MGSFFSRLKSHRGRWEDQVLTASVQQLSQQQHHFPERDHQQQFPEREQQQFPEREPQQFPEREHQQFPEKIPHGSGVFGEEGVVLDRPGAEEEKRTEVKASVGQGKEDEDEDEDGKDGDEGDEEKEEKDAGGKSEGGQKGDEEESDEGSGEGEAGGKKEKKAGDKGESEDEEDGEDDEEDDEEEGGGKEGKKGRSEAGTGSRKKAQDEEGEKEDEEDEEEKEEEKEAKEEAREGEEGSHSSGEGAGEEDEGAGPADDSAAGDAGGDGGGGGSEGENSSSGGGEATGESAGSSEQQSVAAKEVEAAAVAADLVGEPIDVEGCRGRTVYIHKLSLPLSPPSPSISLYSAPLIQKAEAEAVAADPVGEPIDVEGCRGRTVYIHKLAQAYNRGLVEQCATLLPWFSICPHFQNDGLGNRIRNSKLLLPSGRWFETHMCALREVVSHYWLHMYALEMVFHYPLCKAYKSITNDPDRAALFFIPFYSLSPSSSFLALWLPYALEMVFHYRLRKAYKCITSDPDKADLFFIPFYASLDVTRWHFAKNASLDDRDRMHDGLAKWLMRREHFKVQEFEQVWCEGKGGVVDEERAFKKRNGADHFIVLGQGSWDFRRSEGSQWGNRLLLLPEMKHVTKLVLAANLWEDTEIGIPPLTFFHPRWEKDYKTWQRIAESHRRTSLAAFASLRDAFSKHNKALGRQCKKAKACRYLKCIYLECVEDICTRPEVLMDLFTDAAFCIVPSGHTGARRAAFDAIVAGCIPVFLDSFVPSQVNAAQVPSQVNAAQVPSQVNTAQVPSQMPSLPAASLSSATPLPRDPLSNLSTQLILKINFMLSLPPSAPLPSAPLPVPPSSCVAYKWHLPANSSTYAVTLSDHHYKWHLPANSSTYSVTLSEKAVLAGKVDVIKELEKIPGKEVRRMRLGNIREVLPAGVYNHPRMYPMEHRRDVSCIALPSSPLRYPPLAPPLVLPLFLGETPLILPPLFPSHSLIRSPFRLSFPALSRLKIIREVMPAVVYNHPRMYPMEQKRDAFDIAMEEVVRRVQRNKQAAAAA
ncbi:unnamed protein product [Closterium sp. NIES-65]|nr:unnamed protein product [Closterium sp. NIES-65]